jgi:hypothetical protein
MDIFKNQEIMAFLVVSRLYDFHAHSRSQEHKKKAKEIHAALEQDVQL